ncbi:MAG: tannase/feruloyl esterase family alpha/beta hydrolase [Candidatus Solibacter sp.]
MRTVFCLLFTLATSWGASCDSLAALTLADTTITLAKVVGTGAFAPPTGQAAPYQKLAAFCRVTATVAPSKDSDIKLEVWLPVEGWNGKYQAVGNGGWAGSISYGDMAAAVRRGYATSSTDTGHAGGGGSFALGHPEKLIDYAYRSEHEMAVKAKAMITAFYGSGPKLSYWNGCSAGGKQGLKEAQRYPADFDGIVAGAPASNWTGRATQSLWIAQAVRASEASALPADKLATLHRAVLSACDAQDGVKDGVLENPRACRFDVETVACKGQGSDGCLSAAQVAALRKIYAGVHDSDGKLIFPGHEPGSELGWGTMAGARPFAIGLDHFRYVVFKDANWNFTSLEFPRDAGLAARVDAGLIDALDPELKAYFGRGGKLIQYHGWSDPQISPWTSVLYYQSVLAAMGGADKVQSNYRLFMAPGMAHCGGGDGPNQFDMLDALETWVEKGKAPSSVIAARVQNGKTERTRPLCPFPQTAVYRGTGSTDDAANFTCK